MDPVTGAATTGEEWDGGGTQGPQTEAVVWKALRENRWRPVGDACVEGSLAWHSSDRLPRAPSGEPRGEPRLTQILGELRLEVPDARQHPSPCLGSERWW